MTMLMLLLTCQFSLAGAGAGNVLCVGDDGHVAVETRHNVCETSEGVSTASSPDACESAADAGVRLMASDCSDVDLSLLTNLPLMRDHASPDEVVSLPAVSWPVVCDSASLASAASPGPDWPAHAHQSEPARKASHRDAILSTVLRI